MRGKFLLFAIAAAAIAFGGYRPASAADNDLDIEPVMQETPVWCWIAIGEMIFEHYDVPNVNPAGIYQCGIVGTIALTGMLPPVCNANCTLCTVPSGTASRVTKMLEKYPAYLRKNGDFDGKVDANHQSHPLPQKRIVKEIDNGNPIVAGITPGQVHSFSGGAQHVALIVGYTDDGSSLIINDPYPYNIAAPSNPYIEAGATELQDLQYEIAYGDFVDHLNWTESFTVSLATDADDDDDDDDSGGGHSLPHYCCTQFGKFGPFPNDSIPEGGLCHAGAALGQACY